MKLYTEEQVKFIYNCYDFNLDQDGSHIIDEDTYFKQKINSLTPIELPSDEDIRMQTQFSADGFYWGVKWMKEQILNQNK